MSKKIQTALCLVIGLVVIAVAASSSSTLAQKTITGEWTASTKSEQNKLQLNFERRTSRGNRNQMGQSYDFSDLQGLSREQANSGGPVKFSLVREAGRIDCEGSFQNGKGSGTFQFTANQRQFSFAAELIVPSVKLMVRGCKQQMPCPRIGNTAFA